MRAGSDSTFHEPKSFEVADRQAMSPVAAAAAGVTKPAAIWRMPETTVASLLDAEGAVDAELVTTAIAAAVDTLGLKVEQLPRSYLPPTTNAGREGQGAGGKPTMAEFMAKSRKR